MATGEVDTGRRSERRPLKNGSQVSLVDRQYRGRTRGRECIMVTKMGWHDRELFTRVGFIETNSGVPASKVVIV